MILLMFSLSRWAGGLVARFGARLPLTIGPAIAAAGFLLFALPSAGAHYWRGFFPAFVVLGLGMTITVAPLTTVVMSSVKQDLAGTASGINNAVARVAGVLAVAALGVVMVAAFKSRLQSSLGALNLPPGVFETLRHDAIQLAALQPPAGLDATSAASVRAAIQGSFVFAFRIVLTICAGIALISAAIGRFLIASPATASSSSAIARGD
jgi:hypothetical protein